MRDSPPDQSRVWDAFGHAMGAALGLELTMRLAIFEKKAILLSERGPSSQGFERKRQAIINGMIEGTFGQVLQEFLRLYPVFSKSVFEEAITNARDFRNRLGHRFLMHHLYNIQSERGLDLMATECTFYREHFEQLENHIRSRVAIDWDALTRATSPGRDHPAHPLEIWLDAARPDWTNPA